MKLGDIYKIAVTMGIKSDPRGKKEVDRLLKKEKEAYGKLDEAEQLDFDSERLDNPFADTRLLYGEPSTDVKSLMAGVDMEVQEVLLADRLREKGRSVDLVLSHHPEGKGLASLADVMSVQADIWYKAGVPINIGESVLEDRQNEVMRAVMPLNHQRPVMAAELLDIPYMCVHTPCDNLVNERLQKYFDRKGDKLELGEVVDELKKFPEYQQAARESAGPTIVVGKNKRRAGRIMVDMTGGTGGPADAIEKLADAGVGTLVSMHISEKNRKKAEEHKVNVIIAGHSASDSIGMNIFLDELAKKGVEIIPCSGLIRVNRMKKTAKKTRKASNK